jgi:hypothetical protein
MRMARQWLALALEALLAGCALMPERVPLGAPRSEIEARLDQPTAVSTRCPMAAGCSIRASRPSSRSTNWTWVLTVGCARSSRC